MGFWHTGYLDMRDLGPPGVTVGLSRPRRPPPPPTYPCPRCGEVFDTPRGLEEHSFAGHHQPRPVLLYRGLECGSSAVEIYDLTGSQDWATVQADRAWIDGQEIGAEDLPQHLAVQRHRRVTVELLAGSVRAEFDLIFRIADPDELDQVDEHLEALAAGQRLDMRAIEDFVRHCAELGTAERYVDAYAHYFYGVLARERSPESDLPRSAYRDKYELAASVLGQFDRVAARTVTALVAFHFNQFARALARGSDSPRLRFAVERLQRFITGTGHVEAPECDDRGFEAVFADAETERLLRWVTQPFTEAAREQMEEAAAYVQGCEALDQLKLRLVLAEYYVRLGEPEMARNHVGQLLHQDLTEEWARSLRARL